MTAEWILVDTFEENPFPYQVQLYKRRADGSDELDPHRIERFHTQKEACARAAYLIQQGERVDVVVDICWSVRKQANE